eukprot:2277869-Rhodomonas_salina.1
MFSTIVSPHLKACLSFVGLSLVPTARHASRMKRKVLWFAATAATCISCRTCLRSARQHHAAREHHRSNNSSASEPYTLGKKERRARKECNLQRVLDRRHAHAFEGGAEAAVQRVVVERDGRVAAL